MPYMTCSTMVLPLSMLGLVIACDITRAHVASLAVT